MTTALAEDLVATASARALAGRRRRAPRACASCGVVIAQAYQHQKYCSHRCCAREWYRRYARARGG